MANSNVDLYLRRGPFVGGRAEPPAPGGTPTPPAAPPAEPLPPATPPAEPPAAPAAPAAATPPAAAPAAPPAEPSEWEVAFGRGVTARQVQDYIVNLTRQVQATAPSAAPAAAAPPPNLKELIFEDPEKALDHHYSTRIAPALAAIIDQTSQVVGEVVGTQRDGKGDLVMPHFNKYKGEIEQFVGRVDSRLRGRRETWQSAYNYVVGQHLNEIVQEEIGRRAPAVEAGGGAPAPAKGPKVELSAEQAAAAAAMGMTPEEYLEWR